jgi:hypothetical protein
VAVAVAVVAVVAVAVAVAVLYRATRRWPCGPHKRCRT